MNPIAAFAYSTYEYIMYKALKVNRIIAFFYKFGKYRREDMPIWNVVYKVVK